MSQNIIQNLIWLVVILGAVFFVRRFKFRNGTMLSELFIGVILGNLGLVGLHFFAPMAQSKFLEVLSEIAIAFFLFRIGFAATVGEMLKIGARSLAVAILGVAGTFALSFYFVPYIYSGLSITQYVFVAAALSTTSVAITARVLAELRQLHSSGAQIVLGAAVFDDIISLLILALVLTQFRQNDVQSADAYLGIAKILLFIVAGVVIGQLAARYLPKLFYRVYSHLYVGYLVVALFFCAFFFGSKAIGLSTVVGAFIGGLVLESRFLELEIEPKGYGRRIEGDLERFSNWIVPIFFVLAGSHMDFSVLFSIRTILVACALFLIAVLGKMICGIAARRTDNPWLVSLSMIPRGEVGLVFASIAFTQNIIPEELISSIIIVVMLTTFLAPFAIRKVVAFQ